MSASVCLSVCLSVHQHISRTARAIITKFCACCSSPWLGPPQAGDKIPRKRSNLWGFLSPLPLSLFSLFVPHLALPPYICPPFLPFLPLPYSLPFLACCRFCSGSATLTVSSSVFEIGYVETQIRVRFDAHL